MLPNDRCRVQRMIEVGARAQLFLRKRHCEYLANDPMSRLALARWVEIVGEVAAQVSEAARGELAAVRWQQVVGILGVDNIEFRQVEDIDRHDARSSTGQTVADSLGGRIRLSAGMPNRSCKRQIMLSVKGRFRARIS